jgi:endonuclease/exonuclease/phosphatase (EEP) superfamily protein YafD
MQESARYTIRAVSLPGHEQILLAAVHLPSKLYIDEVGHTLECVGLAEAIRETETRANHSRTVLAGDFNMNPFEAGITTAMGLHGVMAKEVAGRGARTVQGASYPFFYNPMWGHFGDTTKGPPGTYYYERADHNVFFWNIFDQVLIRPSLLDVFDNEHLMVLTDDGSDSLLSERGRPDRLAASDHLPLLFRLRL